MLSRIVSRCALPRVSAAVASARPLRQAAFSTATVTAPSSTEENKPAQKGILEEYGMFPIASFITAWAISTEVLIIDPELVLAGMEIAMFATILNAAREPAAAFFKKYEEQETAIVVTAHNANRHDLEAQVELERKFANLTDLVSRIQHYRADLAVQALEAKVRRSKANRNKSVQERLARVAAFEQDLKTRKSQLNSAIAQEVLVSSVTKKITPQVQANITGWLIEHLNTNAQAPLDKINDFIRTEVAAARSEASKGVPKEVKDKFSDKLEDLGRQEQFFKSLVERSD